jgi:hypothetical protein
MKTRHKAANSNEGRAAIAGMADFHGERIKQEVTIEAKNERANRPQGDYEYEQMIAENTVFNPKQMIKEAAFFIAERRGFAPGSEISDWLQAENAVEAMLCSTK